MNKFIMICILAVIFSLPASAQYSGTLHIYDSSVRVEGDSVRVSFKIHINREGAAWFSGILLTPALTNGKFVNPDVKVAAFPNIMVQGKNKNKASERAIRLLGKKDRANFRHPEKTIRVVKDTEMLIDYNYAIPYETWMDSAQLSLYEEIINFRNERQLLVLSIGDKVELPPAEVAPPIEPVQVLATSVVPQKHTIEGEVFIDFPVGSTQILPEYSRNSDELASLREVLTSVLNNSNATIDSLSIKGFASVEGSYANNERLAHDRSLAFRDYILNNFSLSLDSSRFSISWEAEDWDGLFKLVEKSDISGKYMILHIIHTVPVFKGRENQLMRLDGGTPYRIMLRDMFPQLRRVQYRIEYTITE